MKQEAQVGRVAVITAIRTSAAVMFVTIYFSYHKANYILLKYRASIYCTIHALLITSVIFVGQEITLANGRHIKNLNNFGILTWEVGPLSTEVDFLDLSSRHIKIN